MGNCRGGGGRERQPWKDKSKRRSFLIWLFPFLLLLFNCWIESLVLINSSQTVLSPKSDEKEKVVLNGIRSAHWEGKKIAATFRNRKWTRLKSNYQWFFKKSIYLFLAMLGFHCCTWAFFSCSKWGLLSSCGALASHCGGFSSCRVWALGEHGLSGCSSCALEYGLTSCGA